MKEIKSLAILLVLFMIVTPILADEPDPIGGGPVGQDTGGEVVVAQQDNDTCHTNVDGFTICFVSKNGNDWTYTVTSDDDKNTKALSHVVFGLCAYPTNVTTTGGSGGYVHDDGQLQVDPTTGTYGYKLDTTEPGLGEDKTIETTTFVFTLDADYGEGTITVATKAGGVSAYSSDITGPNCDNVATSTPEPTSEPTSEPTDEPTSEPTPDLGTTSCKLYSVHDESTRDSQFFTIDLLTNEVVALNDELHEEKDLEGLDFEPGTGRLFATSGKDAGQQNPAQPSELYLVNSENGDITLVGTIEDDTAPFYDVAALSFRNDGTLWAYGRKKSKVGRKGVIQLDPNTGKVLFYKSSGINAEAVAWSPDGSTLWIAYKKKLYTYTEGGSVSYKDTVSAPDDIEGLGFGPSGYLMAGVHHGGKINIFSMDVSDPTDVKVVGNSVVSTNQFEDVESIAWLDGCEGSLGDTVWNDSDEDGLQDDNEEGIVGAVVNLYEDTDGNGEFNPDTTGDPFNPNGDLLVATTQTNNSGKYLFDNLLPNQYFVALDDSNFSDAGALVGYEVTKKDAGDDDSDDSDGSTSSPYVTTLINLPAETDDMTWDFGLFEPGTTAIALKSFTTEIQGNTVIINWETAAEIDNAGFNIYRANALNGQYEKINERMIGAQGGLAGAVYSFEDTPAVGVYFYVLEDIDTFGLATSYEPVQASLKDILPTRSLNYHPIRPATN